MDKKEIAKAKLLSDVFRLSTEYFHKKGFIQLAPVILSPVTDPLGPDPGSSVIKTGEIEYLGQRLSITQSMILHKQLAIKKGYDKLFIVSPNVRLEHPDRGKSGRHLFEFSQVDFEIKEGKMEEIFEIMESFIEEITEKICEERKEELKELGRELKPIKGPFPRYTTEELLEKYGEDWERLASLEHKTPYWAISHKREFYDKEDPHKPGSYVNYDLIYPEGFGEALSGAEREHEYDKIIRKIRKDELGESKYAAYLEHAKEGLVPSAGGGFGVERLARYITGVKHVGEMQLFKRVPGESVVV